MILRHFRAALTILVYFGAAEILAVCGDSQESMMLSIPNKPDLKSIYQHLRSGELQSAIELIKKPLEILLGSSINTPILIYDQRKSTNPALYVNGTIYVFPNAFDLGVTQGFLPQEHVLPSFLIVLAHELVHAWQDQHTKILKFAKNNQPIIEGQAVFMQSLYSSVYGISAINNAGIKTLTGSKIYENAGNSLAVAEKKAKENEYNRVGGCRFFSSIASKDGGLEVLWELLNNPPKEGLDRNFIENPDEFWSAVKNKLPIK